MKFYTKNISYLINTNADFFLIDEMIFIAPHKNAGIESSDIIYSLRSLILQQDKFKPESKILREKDLSHVLTFPKDYDLTFQIISEDIKANFK